MVHVKEILTFSFFTMNMYSFIYLDYLLFILTQRKVYNTVVEDVIANVREAFLDEGVDEQVLQELKHVSTVFALITALYA